MISKEQCIDNILEYWAIYKVAIFIGLPIGTAICAYLWLHEISFYSIKYVFDSVTISVYTIVTVLFLIGVGVELVKYYIAKIFNR